jgi:hypothetical protein
LNGDEEKIREKIQEWWDEPQEPAEEWEDVEKKSVKKQPPKPLVPAGGGGGFRGGGRAQGRGRGREHGRGGGGGRGGGDRRERGRGGAPTKAPHESVPPKPQEYPKTEATEPAAAPVPQQPAGIPPPATSTPTLKGAWGARSVVAPSPVAAPATPAPATIESPPRKTIQPKPEDTAPPPPDISALDVGVVSKNDPTPSGLSAPVESKPVRPAVAPSGNVWATKGSAHLIQAEKPKPPAPPTPTGVISPAVAPIAPKLTSHSSKPEESSVPVPQSPALVAPEPTLESGLPVAVAGSAWKQPAPAPSVAAQTSIEIPSSPVVPKPPISSIPTVASIEEFVPVSPKPTSAPLPPTLPSPVAPANVLNMGHWETGDGEDSQNLDFGFGSFGDNDVGSMDATTASGVASKEQTGASATSVSPARPPPGLSIGGMPPMPANAVLVHELENKLDSASLNENKEQHAPVVEERQLPTQPTQMQNPHEAHVPNPVLASGGMAQHTYGNQYGMPGMYNYTAAGNGFIGMHTPSGPVLAGGVVPQPGKPQQGGMSQGVTPGGPQSMPQQGLYGTQVPTAPSSGNGVGVGDPAAGGTEGATNPSSAGMPPGMPGGIPYANPALYYGQHQFHMGQHQGGIGYNYGYGAQFGGAVQGGFGYQQVMGQSGVYGAPHYDDQPPHQGSSHHSGGSGGYQKNSGGGYRGRNNHHNNNQYQNQYNPQQHGGYGGQPYGMGYHGDHFNQRGGYGPGGMGDPYGMQQSTGNYQAGGVHSGGGFQDEDHHKGKKGGGGHRGGNGSHNSSLPQFQQQGPPHQFGAQQGFGLQGQVSETTSAAGDGGAGGWSNQGGWSGGGTPSWQGS